MKWALDYIVEPGYFKAMGLRLQRGRFLTSRDDEKAPRVIVVDDVFAKTYFPNQDAIGKRIRSNNFEGTAEIVGVVEHVRQWGLDRDDTEKLRAQMYLPCFQMSPAFLSMTPSGSTAIVRTNRAVTLEQIRSSVQQISHEHVLFAPQTMREIIADPARPPPIPMVLLGVFAALWHFCWRLWGFTASCHTWSACEHMRSASALRWGRDGGIFWYYARDAGTLDASKDWRSD